MEEKGSKIREIERKFLVKSLPADLMRYPRKEIAQGYPIVANDGAEVRLRKIGGRYFQTIKSGGGKVRTEVEIEITKEQFDVLWPATEGKRLEKIRYIIPHRGRKIELDVYRGKLAGLLVAEVEFDSAEESERFSPPAWFGKEVTEDKRYKNKNLALYGTPKKGGKNG
jgi:adenylate cyclase